MPTIAGVTRNHDGSQILSGATVRVYHTVDGALEASGTSDTGSGQYSITVPAGRYFVVAFKEPNFKGGVVGPIDVT